MADTPDPGKFYSKLLITFTSPDIESFWASEELFQVAAQIASDWNTDVQIEWVR